MGSVHDLRITPTVDGIYAGVPAEHYHRWEACSSSRLGRFRRSPAHCKASIDGFDDTTADKAFGTRAHAAILEPELFRRRYGRKARGRYGDRRYREGKAAWAVLVDRFGEENILSADEYDAVERLTRAVHDHPAAGPLIRARGAVELSLLWRDPETGVRCKARLDKHALDLDGGVIGDLKTTRDARPGPFSRSIANFGYHRQGAFYLRGARALDITAAHFVIVCVEKDRPHGVRAYRLEDEAIAAGAEQVERLLPRYAECVASGEWPAYAAEIEDITLPRWAWFEED